LAFQFHTVLPEKLFTKHIFCNNRTILKKRTEKKGQDIFGVDFYRQKPRKNTSKIQPIPRKIHTLRNLLDIEKDLTNFR